VRVGGDVMRGDVRRGRSRDARGDARGERTRVDSGMSW
jgi:hypothetical protein